MRGRQGGRGRRARRLRRWARPRARSRGRARRRRSRSRGRRSPSWPAREPERAVLTAAAAIASGSGSTWIGRRAGRRSRGSFSPWPVITHTTARPRLEPSLNRAPRARPPTRARRRRPPLGEQPPGVEDLVVARATRLRRRCARAPRRPRLRVRGIGDADRAMPRSSPARPPRRRGSAAARRARRSRARTPLVLPPPP